MLGAFETAGQGYRLSSLPKPRPSQCFQEEPNIVAKGVKVWERNYEVVLKRQVCWPQRKRHA